MSSNGGDYLKLLRQFKKVLKEVGKARDEMESIMDRCDEDCSHCLEVSDALTTLCDDLDNALMDFPDYGF